MPALFFPNPDALRLVLASGVLPAAVTAAPARAGWDSLGRLWIDPGVPLPHSTLAGLGRFGVQTLGGGEATPEQVGSWAELLPLRPAPPRAAGKRLFEIPDGLVGRFVRSLGRACPVGVRLLPGDDRRAWVVCGALPPDVLDRWADADAGVEAFVEQAPGVWVRAGWEHPFPEGFTFPPGHVILVRPPRAVMFHAGLPPVPAFPEFALRRRPVVRAADRPPPGFVVRLRLAATSPAQDAELWVFPAEQVGVFRALCQSAGQRALGGYEVAGCREGVVVRRVNADETHLPFPHAGYYPDLRAAGLFVPVGKELRPALRAGKLAALFALAADRITWLEAGATGVPLPRVVARSAFRPLATWVEHTAQPRVQLDVIERADPFALAPFTDERDDERDDAPEFVTQTQPPSVTVRATAAAEPRRGWLARSLDRFARRKGAEPQLSARPRPEKPPGRTANEPTTADALLHGADRAARRQALEARLVREFRGLGARDRANGWAELAAVYAATGNPGDAAVCWVNAVWEADAPPADWLDQWYAAECRAARRPPTEPLDRWLAEPGRFGAARVVAAFTARAAFAQLPPPELTAALPRVISVLDQQFDDLPARMAWLARVAAARLTGGDALGLARWRDRLVARLREKGPGLDLDAPSFLRFHGTASPERFRTARDWLIRVKKPIIDWVEKLGSAGRLQAVGIDAETVCTAAYAQLMLAWGLGCLGERGRSLDWAARARKVLARADDDGVHTFLSGLFASRIRDVQDGRPACGGIPADQLARYDALATLGRDAADPRYVVDKLRDYSRILEPTREGRAFRGLDVKAFRGTDRLGERLQVLADGTDPAVTRDEARELLAACAADPCSATVPRVTLTLLEAAGRLDEASVREALGHVVPAATWLDTWLHAAKWADATRADQLPRYLARLFGAASAAAARFGLADEARPLAEFLGRRAGSDAAVRGGLTRAAGQVFRAFSKLGLGAETETILDNLDPERGAWPADAPFPPARLGLAVGWLAAGDEDAANRLLDDARHRLLFTPGGGDVRDRTELAIGYADALGFAPPRVALGRLEELFQLLDHVTTTGSTNRYYTLKPLELIDTVVRAVVTDDFALGPAVRGWLADDEFLIRRRIHRDVAAAVRGDTA